MMTLLERIAQRIQLTSPRVRGEVGAQRRVRGTLQEHTFWRAPLTLTLSPHAGRGDGCSGASP